MSSDEGMLFWNFGYEGSDYHLDDRGYVVQTEKGEKASLDYGQTGQAAWWMFANFSWERSVLPEPEKGSSEAAEKEILDVYKRQLLFPGNGDCRGNALIFRRRRFHDAACRKRDHKTRHTFLQHRDCQPGGLCPGPVSYTHLDVYKRQTGRRQRRPER